MKGRRERDDRVLSIKVSSVCFLFFPLSIQIQFVLLFSRQGKCRLQKWYQALTTKEKKITMRALVSMVLGRKSKMCHFLEYKELKIVYKRCVCVRACVCLGVCIC